MANITTSAVFPTSAITDGSGGLGTWVNPTNVYTDNAAVATCTAPGSSFVANVADVYDYLEITGFDFSSIPDGNIILGISVAINKYRSGGTTGQIRDNTVQLLVSGTKSGSNYAYSGTNWGTGTGGISYYGGTLGYLWGLSLTGADVKASGFGVALRVVGSTSTTDRIANVDYVSITITHADPSLPYVREYWTNDANASGATVTGFITPLSGNVIILSAVCETGTTEPTITFPTGFTSIASQFSSAGYVQKVEVAYKISDGTETSLSITSDIGTYTGLIYHEYGSLDTSAIESNTGVTASGTTLTVSLTPTGGTNHVYLYSVSSSLAYGTTNALSYDSGFIENAETFGGNVKIGTAWKEDTAADGESVTVTSTLAGDTLVGVLVEFDAVSTGPGPKEFEFSVNETETLSINLTQHNVHLNATVNEVEAVAVSLDVRTALRSLVFSVVETETVGASLGRNRAMIGGTPAPRFTSISSIPNQNHIAYSPSLGLWISSPQTTATVYGSSNGTSWTSQATLPITPTTSSIVWSSTLSLFVLVGHVSGTGFCYTSPDGTTWTVRTIGASAWTNVAEAGGNILAVAAGSSTMNTSTNGTTWSSYTWGCGSIPASLVLADDGVGTRFCWVATNGTQYGVYTWGGGCGGASGGTVYIKGLQRVGTRWVGVGTSTAGGNTNVVTFISNTNTKTTGTMSSSRRWTALVYDSFNGYLTAFAGGTSVRATSDTGTSWTESSVLPSTTTFTTAASNGLGQIVAYDSFSSYSALYVDNNVITGPIAINETMSYVPTLTTERIKDLAFSISEALTYSVSLDRNRNVSYTINESSSYVAMVLRNRLVDTSVSEQETVSAAVLRSRVYALPIVEAIAHTIALDVELGVTLFSFTVAEVSGVVVELARERGETFTVAETETIAAMALDRARQIVEAIAEQETIGVSVDRQLSFVPSVTEEETASTSFGRVRNNVVTIGQSETMSASIGRLRTVASTLAETFGYTIDLTVSAQVFKYFEAAINETALYDFGTIRRLRNVLSQISEVTNYVLTLSRDRGTQFTVEEQEVITDSIIRLRGLVSAINEVETVSLSVSRQLALEGLVGEIEDVDVNLSRSLFVSTAINESENVDIITIDRNRSVDLTIDEQQFVEGTLGRVRFYVTNVGEQETLTDISLDRVREVLPSINQSEVLLFELARHIGVDFSVDEQYVLTTHLTKGNGRLQVTVSSSVWVYDSVTSTSTLTTVTSRNYYIDTSHISATINKVYNVVCTVKDTTTVNCQIKNSTTVNTTIEGL